MDAFPHDSVRGELAAPINEIAVKICDEVESDRARHLQRVRVGLPTDIDPDTFRKLLRERLSLSGIDFVEVEIEDAEKPSLLSTHFTNEWAE